jgi:hypothetical protein
MGMKTYHAYLWCLTIALITSLAFDAIAVSRQLLPWLFAAQVIPEKQNQNFNINYQLSEFGFWSDLVDIEQRFRTTVKHLSKEAPWLAVSYSILIGQAVISRYVIG